MTETSIGKPLYPNSISPMFLNDLAVTVRSSTLSNSLPMSYSCLMISKELDFPFLKYGTPVVGIRVLRLFLNPFLCIALCGNHCKLKFCGLIFLLFAYLFRRLSLMSYNDLAFSKMYVSSTPWTK